MVTHVNLDLFVLAQISRRKTAHLIYMNTHFPALYESASLLSLLRVQFTVVKISINLDNRELFRNWKKKPFDFLEDIPTFCTTYVKSLPFMNSIQETLKDTNVGEIMSYCIYYMYIVSIQHVIFKIVCLRYSTNKKLKIICKNC